jgi:hypothetical protein
MPMSPATYNGAKALLERDFAADPANLSRALDLLEQRNFAEQIEFEANQLARTRLVWKAEQTGQHDKLSGWLERLVDIHATNMAEAAKWTPPAVIPGRLTPPYDRVHMTPDAIAQQAANSVAKATEEPTNARD